MSRHGYTDDCGDDDPLVLGRWRGRVMSATRGQRGQKMFQELLAALDAMPEKRLIEQELECEGEVCAFGALRRARVIDMSGIDPEDNEQIADVFDVAQPLACEVMYMNDDWHNETPERRWERMRAWVEKQITTVPVDEREDGA